MEALKPMMLLDGIERGIHEVKLKQRLAKDVIAGRSVDPDACKINRHRPRQPGKCVGRFHQIGGVDVLRPGWIEPREVRPELSKIVALKKDHWTCAFAARGGEIVADAKILPIDRQP